MAYIRCDVASNGPYRYQQAGEEFPRCDVSPVGGWVASDCHADGSVYVNTSAGQHLELGPRAPINPACPRYQTDGLFHLYMVAVEKDETTGEIKQIFGRHLIFDALGHYLSERDHFDASAAGSQGILDVTPQGEILWWDQHNWREIDGLVLRSPRERGDFIVGVLQENWLGISVYEKSTGHWYRAFPYDVQLLAGIATDGTVAAQGFGGGFIERADWVTRRFDPHHVGEPVPPTITNHPDSVTVELGKSATFIVEATGTEPLSYQWFANGHVVTGAEAPTFTTPPLTTTTVVSVTIENVVGSVQSSVAVATVIDPPDPEPAMPAHSVVKVNNELVHVVEGPHQDANIGVGPVISVARITDGAFLRVNDAGGMDWKPKDQGAGGDERHIPVPGAYVQIRGSDANKCFLVTKAGPWNQ